MDKIVEVNQNPSQLSHLQTTLSNLAFADLDHDFTESGLLNASNRETAELASHNGIPKVTTKQYDEDKVMSHIIQANGNTDGRQIIRNLSRSATETRIDNLSTGFYSDDRSMFHSLHNYSVHKIPLEDDNFTQKFIEAQPGGGKQYIALVIDTDKKFIRNLKKGGTTGFTIYNLMTPEVISDPAGKPNPYEKSSFGGDVASNGIKLVSYVQGDVEDMVYRSYKLKPTGSYDEMFYSNYSFSLSPIMSKYIGKTEQYDARLTVSNGKKSFPIENIKQANSKNALTELLFPILNRFMGRSNTDEDKFDFNRYVQQKRSGDWLQALACLHAKTHTYTEILPNRGTNRRLPDDCPIYFVSIDRIAVSYALLLGINVIYLDYAENVIMFKNKADPNIQGGRIYEEALFSTLKEKYFNGESSEFNDLLDFNRRYVEIYNTVEEKYRVAFEDACDRFLTDLNGLNESNIFQNYEKKVSEKLTGIVSMYRGAVSLAFVEKNVLNVKKCLDEIKESKSVMNGEYDPKKHKAILEFNRHLSVLVDIYERYNTIGNIETEIQETTKKIPNLREYIAVGKIVDSPYTLGNQAFVYQQLAESFDNRIVEITSGSETANVDINIFLPYIQSLSAKEQELLRDVTYKLIDCNRLYLSAITGNSSSGFMNTVRRMVRGNGPTPQQLFYNRMTNFIYESLIFIQRGEPLRKSIRPDEMIYSNCSDDVIVELDFNNVARGESAPSNTSVRGGEYIKGSGKRARSNSNRSRSVRSAKRMKIGFDTYEQTSSVYRKLLTYQVIEASSENKFDALAFHPCLPIYILLSSIYDSFMKSETDASQCISVLKSMIKDISFTEENVDYSHAIGLGLRTLFFMSPTNDVLYSSAIKLFKGSEKSKEQQRDLLSYCSSLTWQYMGYVNLNKNESLREKEHLEHPDFIEFVGKHFGNVDSDRTVTQKNILSLMREVSRKIKTEKQQVYAKYELPIIGKISSVKNISAVKRSNSNKMNISAPVTGIKKTAKRSNKTAKRSNKTAKHITNKTAKRSNKSTRRINKTRRNITMNRMNQPIPVDLIKRTMSSAWMPPF